MRGFFNRLKDIWVIAGITILLFILIELFFRIYFLFSSDPDPRIQADCYNNADWVEAYYSEFNACNESSWKPYVYWRRNPFKGTYINIDDDGIRKTIYQNNPSSDYDPLIRIFMFGGSAMWGTGARDEYTLASLLGKELSKKGFRVQITNFGESGYVNTQELIELQLELRKGNIPDLVIFYDGANDLFSTLQQGKAGIPQNEFNRMKQFNTLTNKKRSALVFFKSLQTLATVKFIRQKFGSEPDREAALKEFNLPKLAEETIGVYNENLRLIYALSEAYGFHSVFYWQPLIFNKNIRTEYENTEFEKMKWASQFAGLTIENLTDDEIHLDNLDFYDLSRFFENETAPVYVDWCHVGEYGNSKLAKQIAQNVIPVCDSILAKTEKQLP